MLSPARDHSRHASETAPISASNLMNLLPVGLYVCNPHGLITHYSSKAAEIWGREPKLFDADDMYCGSFRLYDIDGNRLPHAESPMAEALRTQSHLRDLELLIERPDGSRATILTNISPIYDDDGNFVGAANCFKDISARKRVEERMGDEIRFRESIELCTPAGLTAMDRDGRIVYANRAFCELVGWAANELVGISPPFPFWSPDDLLQIESAMHDTMAGHADAQGYNVTFRKRTGEPIEVLLRTAPLVAHDGSVQGWLASISDITDLRHAERTARFLMSASVEIADSLDYETILDKVANLIVPAFGDWCIIDVLEPNGELQHVATVHTDPQLVELAHRVQRNYPVFKQEGGTAEVIRTGKGVLITDFTEEMLIAAAKDQHHLDLLREFHIRSMMILPVSARGRIHGAITILSSNSGRRFVERDYEIAEQIARHCAIAIDKARLFQEAERELQERTRAEQALRISEERLRFTLDAAAVGTWDWNMTTGRVQWSENLCRIHGVDPDSLSGTFDDFLRDVHPSDRAKVRTAIQQAIEGNGTYHVEYRLDRQTSQWIEAKGRVLYNHDRPVAMAGICMDITERRLLEERFRVAVEASPSALIMVDGAGTIAMVNSLTERLFGYSRKELLGQPVDMLVPERFRRNEPSLRSEFLAPLHARPMGAGRDLYCVRKDGTEFPVEIGLSPVQMPEGTFVLSAIVDITERKRAESEIRTINEDLRVKNREMEQFVYTVSHDLKSPIVTIMGFLGMLREDLEEGTREDVLDSVQRIERATQRMSELIDDLLELSRIGRVFAEPEPVPVADLVQSVLDDLEERIKDAGASVVVHAGMPVIRVDRKRFVDVFENLLTNALKYGCGADEPKFEVGWARTDDDIRLFVRDNGAGIDAEYHTRIFGLFQRLDTSQEGTGVGLAIVARVVEVHGGKTWVESTPGTGATFWIALPHDRIVS